MEVKILNSYLKTWYVSPMVVVERVIQVSDQPPFIYLVNHRAETTKSNLFCLEKWLQNHLPQKPQK